MRTRTLISQVSVLSVLAVLLWVPTSAWADLGGAQPDPSGYTVTARINFSGDGLKGGTGSAYSKDVRVHPSCWWAPAAGSYTDMQAMLAWYKEVTGGQASTADMLHRYGPLQVWQDAADQEAAGAHLRWFMATCVNPDDYTKFGIGAVQDTDAVNGDGQNWQTYLYHAYPVGEEPPAPLVSTAELARLAREEMVIRVPELNWNPKLRGNQSTLVGLPTWFWVEDPLSVGGTVGELKVKAELAGTDIWATVTAKTDGLNIDSPWSNPKTCAPADAHVVYAAGGQSTSPCMVTFLHSGTPVIVNASTAWGATWTGSDGAGGDLEGLTQAGNTPVPVAEVQNIVTR